MPSVLLGNRCVTFIRCLGGALVSAVAGVSVQKEWRGGAKPLYGPAESE